MAGAVVCRVDQGVHGELADGEDADAFGGGGSEDGGCGDCGLWRRGRVERGLGLDFAAGHGVFAVWRGWGTLGFGVGAWHKDDGALLTKRRVKEVGKGVGEQVCASSFFEEFGPGDVDKSCSAWSVGGDGREDVYPVG